MVPNSNALLFEHHANVKFLLELLMRVYVDFKQFVFCQIVSFA